MVEHIDIHRYTDPGQDGEEAEGNGSSGSVRALGQWQLLRGGSLPLIGQKTEANKPQEAGNTWRRDKVQSKQMYGVMYINKNALFIINWYLIYSITILQFHVGKQICYYITATCKTNLPKASIVNDCLFITLFDLPWLPLLWSNKTLLPWESPEQFHGLEKVTLITMVNSK